MYKLNLKRSKKFIEYYWAVVDEAVEELGIKNIEVMHLRLLFHIRICRLYHWTCSREIFKGYLQFIKMKSKNLYIKDIYQ